MCVGVLIFDSDLNCGFVRQSQLTSNENCECCVDACCTVVIPLFFFSFVFFFLYFLFYFIFSLKIVHRYTSTGGPSLPAFRPVYSTMRYWERRGPSIRDQRTPVSFHRFQHFSAKIRYASVVERFNPFENLTMVSLHFIQLNISTFTSAV